jgi:hypothetical protein
MRAVVLLVLLIGSCNPYTEYCYLPRAGQVVVYPMDEDAGIDSE